MAVSSRGRQGIRSISTHYSFYGKDDTFSKCNGSCDNLKQANRQFVLNNKTKARCKYPCGHAPTLHHNIHIFVQCSKTDATLLKNISIMLTTSGWNKQRLDERFLTNSWYSTGCAYFECDDAERIIIVV